LTGGMRIKRENKSSLAPIDLFRSHIVGGWRSSGLFGERERERGAMAVCVCVFDACAERGAEIARKKRGVGKKFIRLSLPCFVVKTF